MNDHAWLRARRVANTGLFFLTGLAMALWVVNIPTVQIRTGVSNSTLGLLLLALGAGSVVGMQVAGWVSDRFGSRRTAGVAVVIIAIAIMGPAIATTGWHLAALLPLLGLGTGSITVAANDQAVRIQDAYGRPIMSGFHGFFSIAGACGAGVGAIFHALDVPLGITLGTASVGVILLGAASVPRLLGIGELAGTSPPPNADLDAQEMLGDEEPVLGKAVALASLAFLLMLAEGTATDWSVLHAVEHLDLSESVASLAYGTFAVAMTVGRLTADRVVARVGPVALVRWGSLLAGIGLSGVVLSPLFEVTLLGWLLFGLGLSGIVPQLFTAAGRLSVARRGVVLSRVVGAGYVGLLAGPAIIGWISDAVGINAALLAPVVACAAGVVLASIVRPANRKVRSYA
ncbi:MFS transporter [Sanguibacter sp. 25GB23B1]|uniref:MFS transporter n=1 Tax=unclassified Sanguibacter TaxID=2645534 RepID=UPI0032AEF314